MAAPSTAGTGSGSSGRNSAISFTCDQIEVMKGAIDELKGTGAVLASRQDYSNRKFRKSPACLPVCFDDQGCAGGLDADAVACLERYGFKVGLPDARGYRSLRQLVENSMFLVAEGPLIPGSDEWAGIVGDAISKVAASTKGVSAKLVVQQLQQDNISTNSRKGGISRAYVDQVVKAWEQQQSQLHQPAQQQPSLAPPAELPLKPGQAEVQFFCQVPREALSAVILFEGVALSINYSVHSTSIDL